MQNYVNNTCDLDLNVSVPASLSEAVSLFGEDAVLTAAIRQTFYGPWNSGFRKAFTKKLEEVTGIARRPQMRGGEPVTTTKKDGTKVPVLETESKYLAFLLEEGHVTEADYARVGAEVAAEIKFEIPPAERQSAPGKDFVNAAKTILAKVENGVPGRDGNPITEESFTSAWEAVNPGITLEALGGFTVEGIARALQQDAKRRQREATEAFA